MSLFQTSVVKKYLNELSPELIDKKYTEFQTYFGNPEIQQNIRESKEEEYQSGFVSALFVNILGYTLKPDPNYNFVLEKKNIDDSKKADGAILKDNDVIAVIELKSTQTTDLDTVETQAFGYKNHNPKCQYIITSNFEKIRLYIQNAVDHIEFDLFNLSREDFALLWLCFLKDNILQDIPLKIKEASVLQEENITKKLYSDYSKFRQEIFNNIVKNNHGNDKLVLFKKTQKLLDRFLFIFFAEDRLLVPPNSISEIVKQWNDLKDNYDEYFPLYDRFKKYFGYLNTGYKGKKYDIFPYNGGLFAPDEILDNIKIDDEILHKHTVQLSTYDFETEVDVNILGHIFEHSLGEIENVQAEIKGEEVDKQKTRRKKDGIFYTPKYIIKYIVENTVGKLCEEKRAELEIIDEEYAKGRKNRKKDIVRALDDKLTTYREWLLDITILDPACGSGAFLNQALEFLIQEHKKIDELKFQLLGGSIVFPDVEAKILEKNIYGVDLNEESVEIAKLSLWLRTAQKGRKLTTLSNHIKCGNSLIDDPEIAGEKAFNWQSEFPEVFAKGGFDIVIGNPPYGAELLDVHKSFLANNYETFEYQVNTYVVFYEHGLKIAKTNGMLGYITPATFTYQHYFKKLRAFMQTYTQIGISKYFYEVFEDADIGDSVSWIMQKKENSFQNILIQLCKTKEDAMVLPESIPYNSIININDKAYNLSESGLEINKFSINTIPLVDIAEIIVGIKPYQTGKGEPKQTREIVNEKIFTSDHKVDESYINCVIGKDFHRYRFIKEPSMYLSYGKWLAEPRESAPFFDNEKIIIRQTADSIIGVIDNKKRINLNNVYNIGLKDSNHNLKYILGLLNSKLLNFIYQNISQEKGRTFAEVKKIYLTKLPIKKCHSETQNEIASRVKKILKLNEKLQSLSGNFLILLQSKFEIEKVTNKLNSWFSLDYKEFIKELKKYNIKLSLSEESELIQYFKEQKREAIQLEADIKKVDKQIDQMVYKLYGLTEEEIKIIEETN